MQIRQCNPLIVLLAMLGSNCMAQMNPGNNYAAPAPNPPAVQGTTAAGSGGYALSPMLYTQPQTYVPRVTGTVRKYSPVEYGRVVLSAIGGRTYPETAATASLESIVHATTDPVSGLPQYDPVSIEVVQVLDRGVLLSHSREEVRLRGVRIPSGQDSDEVVALYGREAKQLLTHLTAGKLIHLALGQPLRDKNGYILAMAYLPDGTELNQLLLNMGYAKLHTDDFAVGSNLEQYKQSEAQARTQNLGIWSRNSSSSF